MVLVFSVNSVSLRQAITPDRLLGRVNGTMRFIVWGSRPIGSLGGGYLGSRIGLPATLVVGAFGMLLAFVPLLASPIRGCAASVRSELGRQRTLPPKPCGSGDGAQQLDLRPATTPGPERALGRSFVTPTCPVRCDRLS